MLCNTPGTLLELAVVWVCSEYLFHGYVGQYVVSPVIAFECAVVTNFVLYSRCLWYDRIKGVGMKGYLIRLLGYNVSATGVYFMRMVVIQVIGMLWHLPVVWCEIISLSLSGIINYMINDRVIFCEIKQRQ